MKVDLVLRKLFLCLFCGLLPLMKNIVAPLFSDEEFVNMLIEAMKADPDFGSMAGMAEGMLKGLPEIINETTRLEVGLNLTAAK